ncbi:16S rRNA (guanine(966)-N(2))-methyltransferase RsmD [Microvirga sp. 2MCAF38]|uniref:16S rRNA (guanine(966)-N(2))-methyltransferase RsmD n=1 Tax=Microvirga sp. 2MCAF38 TaxID=3232989 RepID=UPI003F9B4BFC
MRIVGGRWRGRSLAGPTSDAIRPTSDRLREALFNILQHGYDDPITGARVMDLFAGTGAMGLEALSRGASFALLVDDGAEARGLIRENVEAVGAGGATRLFRRDATRMGEAAPNAPFSLVFCDPPYGKDLAPKALKSCAEGGWLTPDALVVVEEARGAVFALPEGFEEIERRDYGETTIVFGRYLSPSKI